MLSLTRRPGERIFIGPPEAPWVKISVASIRIGADFLSAELRTTLDPQPRTVHVGGTIEFDLPESLAGRCIVRVLSIQGDQVRLGIDAIKSVQIHREEIAQRIMAEGIDAHRRNDSGAQFARLVLLLLCAASLAGMGGCANYASIEVAHTSHPFAGPPFGDRHDEDSLDRVNACVGRDRGGWFAEGCIGYKYAEGGFYGPKVSFDGRIGRKFRFGDRL